MTQRTSNQENSLPTSNEQLYTCSCAEYYGSHHPECPARQQFDRLRAKVKQQRMQLPKGMEHCTIHFIECEVGHGRLTATNWIDHVCHWCKIDAKDRELDRLRADVERLTAKLREEQELVEVNLSRMYDRALAYMRERDRLRAEVERLRSAPHCPACGCGRGPA